MLGLYAHHGPRTLRVSQRRDAGPLNVTIRQLGDGEGFTIPPGQFAFLLTEEKIEVPNTALAFISIKAKIKLARSRQRLWLPRRSRLRGRLIFSVYNAGPVTVHLRQGQPMFLIWFASLDKPTALARNQPVQESFPPDLISGISGELQSLAGINKKIKDLDRSLTDRVHSIEREQTYYRFIAIIVVAVLIAMITTWIRDGGGWLVLSRHPLRQFNRSLLPPPRQLVRASNCLPKRPPKRANFRRLETSLWWTGASGRRSFCHISSKPSLQPTGIILRRDVPPIWQNHGLALNGIQDQLVTFARHQRRRDQ